MKIYNKSGKEVKNAQVIYDVSGKPNLVRVEGVNFALDGFKIEDDKPTKKTRQANDSVMTTKSTPTKRKK